MLEYIIGGVAGIGILLKALNSDKLMEYVSNQFVRKKYFMDDNEVLPKNYGKRKEGRYGVWNCCIKGNSSC